MSQNTKKILVLYRQPGFRHGMRLAIRENLYALDSLNGSYKTLYYNTVLSVPKWLRNLKFDAVVLHSTFLCMRWRPNFDLRKSRLNWISTLKCPIIALPQDEYDHSEILDEWLHEWNVSVIFSCFDERVRKILYPRMCQKAKFLRCYTGYIDDKVAEGVRNKLTPLKNRPYDVVYRAAHLPYWFGSHGQVKHRIADLISGWARDNGLRCDISTNQKDTIVGYRWLDFLASGRCVIGCESGSSVLDPRGEIQAKIQKIVEENPNLSFEQISALMPNGWDSHSFFAVSPRHFEAIITKTCQILVEGDYDGIFEADKHYIALRRDYSNLEEVLERIRDVGYLQTIVDRAYQDIYLSGKYSYLKLTEEIGKIIPNRMVQNFDSFGRKCLWPLGKAAGHVSNSLIGLAGSIYSQMRQLKDAL
jgi:hypothetical protein